MTDHPAEPWPPLRLPSREQIYARGMNAPEQHRREDETVSTEEEVHDSRLAKLELAAGLFRYDESLETAADLFASDVAAWQRLPLIVQDRSGLYMDARQAYRDAVAAQSQTTGTPTPQEGLMMVSKKSLDQLDAAAQDAMAKASAARDAADQARAEEQARRQERLDAYDQRQRDAFDAKQLRDETAAAQRSLTDAVLADPVWQAVIAVGVAQRREIHRWQETGGTGQSPLPSGANRLDPEYLATVADRAANDQMEDELDERAQARVAAGDGPS